MVLPVRLVPAKTGKAKIASAKMVKERRARKARTARESRLESLAKEMASPRLGRVYRIVESNGNSANHEGRCWQGPAPEPAERR